MNIITFNFPTPRRVKIDSKWKWLRWAVRKKHNCVYVSGGNQFSGQYTNEQLSKLYITSISVINPQRITDLFILDDQL